MENISHHIYACSLASLLSCMRNIQHHVLLIYMFGCSLLSGSLQFTAIITASSDDNFRSVQFSSSSACRKKATLPLWKGKLVCCGKQGNRGSKLKTQNGAPLWLRLVSESVPLQLGSPCLGGLLQAVSLCLSWNTDPTRPIPTYTNIPTTTLSITISDRNTALLFQYNATLRAVVWSSMPLTQTHI